MLQEHGTVIEQVRTLAAPLSNAERLALIRAIASRETPEREAPPRSDAGRQAFDAEQEAWFARPPAKRQRYAGEYVAVQDGQVAVTCRSPTIELSRPPSRACLSS